MFHSSGDVWDYTYKGLNPFVVEYNHAYHESG